MVKNSRSSQLVPREPQVILPSRPAHYASAAETPRRNSPTLGLLLLRRWKWFTFCTLLSFAVALAVAARFQSSLWTYTSTVLFERAPAGTSEYAPPSLATLAHAVESPRMLAALQSEFAPQVPRQALAKSIRAEVPYGADSVIISFTWGDAEQAEAMLTRLLELFAEQLGEMRQGTLEAFLADAEASLEASKQRVDLAKQAYLEFGSDQQVIDVPDDLTRLQEQLDEIELTLETARLAKANSEAQLDKLTAAQETELAQASAPSQGSESQSGQVVQASATSAVDSQQAEAETLDDEREPQAADIPKRLLASVDLQRRSFLQERLREEQQRIATRAKINLARQEYERAKSLHAKRYISDAEYQRIEAELNTLLAMQQSAPVQRWKRQLDEINARMPNLLYDNLTYGQMSPDMLAQTVAQLELSLIAREGEIEHLEELLATKRAEMDRVLALRKQSQELTDNVNIATLQRQKAEARLAALRNSLRAEADGFTIIQPPGPALEPETTDARRLFLLTFGCVGLLLTMPTLAVEVLSKRERPAESAARRLGLPVLARSTLPALSQHAYYPLEAGRDDECPRMLALRIQQFLQHPGSVLLFSSLNHRSPSVSLIARVAQCFVQRGEQVVLVDISKTLDGRQAFSELLAPAADEGKTANARGSKPRFLTRTKVRPADPAGVADFVTGEAADVERLIAPTRLAGVDCLLAGSTPLPVEGMASRRMSELFDQLRQRYTRVIVVGPTTAHPVDLEMLAARVDGIIFSTVGPRTENMDGEQVVSDLIDVDAPVLGFVS